MSRAKAFDPTAKIDDAMLLFWANGFEATGVQSIVDNLGISRGSLYATFGDKDALWHRALERYCENMTAYLGAVLEDESRPGLVRVEQVLNDVIDPPVDRPCGCLLTRAITERMAEDPITAGIVQAQLMRARGYLLTALSSAQDKNEIPAHFSTDDLADFFLSVLEGLYVLDAARSATEPMRATVRVAMQSVRMAS
ncbi:TetR/AcrR family transcriptional regulator [uncultured Arthrobacter sp.]|uniref:TetR/AcrR family transcriptional regulator n=1 Tax=uncultured Arthrobacter sp. TaxID=114050 RepID=UPI0025E04120|nr:TetR/AcrR family transcriptional regulator [uncultured Arthrobacter sp.]